MKGWLVRAVVGSSVMLLGASIAHAADGRVTFTGAILAPTCAVGEATTAALVKRARSGSPSERQGRCGRAAANPIAGAQSYYVAMVSALPVNPARMDPLLEYFAGYLKASGDQPPHLLTVIFY